MRVVTLSCVRAKIRPRYVYKQTLKKPLGLAASMRHTNDEIQSQYSIRVALVCIVIVRFNTAQTIPSFYKTTGFIRPSVPN